MIREKGISTLEGSSTIESCMLRSGRMNCSQKESIDYPPVGWNINVSINYLLVGWIVNVMIYFISEISCSSLGWPSYARKRIEETFDSFMHTLLSSGRYNTVGRAPLLQLGLCNYGLDV